MDSYETLIDDEPENEIITLPTRNNITTANSVPVVPIATPNSFTNLSPIHNNSSNINNNNSYDENQHHNHEHNREGSQLKESTNSNIKSSASSPLKSSISALKQSFSPLKSPLSTFSNLGNSSFLKNSTSRFKSSSDSTFMQSLRSSTSRFLIGTDITSPEFNPDYSIEDGGSGYLQQHNIELDSIGGGSPISATPNNHLSPAISTNSNDIHQQQQPQTPNHASLLLSSLGFDILNQSFGETGALLTFSSDNIQAPLQTSYSHRRTNIHDKVSLLNSSSASSVMTRSTANSYQKIRASTAGVGQQQQDYINIKSSSIDGANTLINSAILLKDPKDELGVLDEVELDTLDSDQNKVDSIPKTGFKKYLHMAYEKRGLLFMVFSSFLFSLMALLVKVLSKELGSLEIGFLRSFYGFFTCLGILRILKVNPLGEKQYRHLLFIRGLSGTFSLIAYFLTLTVLPLSEAVIISFTSPVITAALAAFVLKEKWGKFEAICAFLSLSGVVIVAKPSFIFHSAAAAAGSDLSGTKRFIFFLVGIAGACFTAISYITVRKVGPSTNPFVLVAYFSAIGSIVHFPAIFIFQKFVFPSLKAWGIITAMALLAVIAQASVNRGLQLEKASRAAAMNYIQIVFTIIWEIIFLHESVDLITLGGTALILSCSVITALKK